MYMQLMRLKDDTKSTIGTLYVNGAFECFTLEDTFNFPKVYGKTRIPDGTYEIKLRNEGGLTKKYAEKYPYHKGMLWLQNVDNFEWVYIHVGNTADHTDGCILVGEGCMSTTGDQKVTGSVNAYVKLYKKAIGAFERGEDVTIEIM